MPGANCSASRCQLKTTLAGQMTSEGAGPCSSRRCCSHASACTVLPRPMSSASRAPSRKRDA